MIKLNIQRFGHTNSTSNYELPQFIGTDKPQWLTDINQAFASIDTAIHTVSVLANLNSTKIGDLTDLSTDNKIDLVSAINEVDSHVDSNTNTIAGHTIAIGANTTAIGNLTDLDTVDKADLVSAINEVDLLSKNNAINIGSLSNLETDSKTSIVSSINEIVEKFNLTTFTQYTSSDITITVANESGTATIGSNSYINVAKNNDGSIAKVYGYVTVDFSSSHSPSNYFTILLNKNTGLNPNEAIIINSLGNAVIKSGQTVTNFFDYGIRINTNGTINIGRSFSTDSAGENFRIVLHPCLLFVKDFGDVPSPTP